MHLCRFNFIFGFRNTRTRGMASFTQTLNPLNGKNEWIQRSEEYDYHAEVANAGFGDMLHDSERNQKYFLALRKTINQMHNEGRQVHVLDIGTGTGILSWMALQAGADTVTACEAFLPMANCAERILAANGVADRVQLIKKRSTEIQIGKDMSRKANLLVTEVLDTELIGEGAIGIYNHAHKELLTEDVICIPSKATCYAQVAESPLAANWNSLKILANLDGDVLLRPSKEILSCKGEASLHDVQLSQLPLTDFRPLTKPVEIFEFDFNRKALRETNRQRKMEVETTQVGTAQMVFYWWDIKMDLAGEIVLSCAPFWAHPDFKSLSQKHNELLPLSNVIPWRDHWMQAIYYLPKSLQLHTPNTKFSLICNHDEYSLWFDAYTDEQCEPDRVVPRHFCNCGLHIAYARSRIGQMNQSTRNKRFLRVLEKSVTKDSRVLVLSDGCVLGLVAAKLGAFSVVCHEPNGLSRRFLTALSKENSLENVQIIENLDQLSEAEFASVTHVFSEPYFLNAILPWDNFYFGTLLMQIKEKLKAQVRLTPNSAHIFAMPVEFLDLHKIRTAVVNCEGYDLTLFDKMVESSMEVAQSKIEAQPLWEYPCRALSEPQEILAVDFNDYNDNKSSTGIIELTSDGICNGVALWVDWNLDDSDPKATVSSGPSIPVEPGKFVKWDMFVRQGVHFIHKPRKSSKNDAHLHWELSFQPIKGKINFNFRLAHTNT